MLLDPQGDGDGWLDGRAGNPQVFAPTVAAAEAPAVHPGGMALISLQHACMGARDRPLGAVSKPTGTVDDLLAAFVVMHGTRSEACVRAVRNLDSQRRSPVV